MKNLRKRLATLVIIAAVAIGAFTAGKLIYQHDGGNAAVSLTASTLSSTQQATSQQTTAAAPVAPTVTYLHVKEWGVKLPLPANVNDAYYVPSASSRSADGTPNSILLGLRSLDSKGCAAEGSNHGQDSAIALIFRALPTDTDPVSGKLLTQEYPNGVSIKGYYYGFENLIHTTCQAPPSTLTEVNSALATTAKDIATGVTN